jgi:hypothetical protein
MPSPSTARKTVVGTMSWAGRDSVQHCAVESSVVLTKEDVYVSQVIRKRCASAPLIRWNQQGFDVDPLCWKKSIMNLRMCPMLSPPERGCLCDEAVSAFANGPAVNPEALVS